MGVIDNGDGTLTRTGLPDATKKMLTKTDDRLVICVLTALQAARNDTGKLAVKITLHPVIRRELCRQATGDMFRVESAELTTFVGIPVVESLDAIATLTTSAGHERLIELPEVTVADRNL